MAVAILGTAVAAAVVFLAVLHMRMPGSSVVDAAADPA
jgi:hypothetical protein